MGRSTRFLLLGCGIFVVACVVLALVGVLLFLPAGSIMAPVPSPFTGGSSSSAWYQVYFTAPRYPDKESAHHGSVDEKLTAFINSAQKSVDMAIYQLDLPNVTQALVDANQRGVTVRIVTDIDILHDSKENPSFLQLAQAGIPVVGGNPNAIMHDKFVVVDGTAVWTGSWNFTVNDTYRYNNNAVVIQSPELAHNYTVTFEKMFKDDKFGPARKPGGVTPRLTISGAQVENYFAPEDKVTSKILPWLQGAKSTIDFMAFSFTDGDIGQAVVDRSRAGVQVRGVFEKTGSETPYSQYGKMRKDGMDVWQDGNPYLMHHKVFIIDDRIVIFGSFNFSKNADEENDENLLIVDDPSLALQFQAEFDRVYEQAKAPPVK